MNISDFPAISETASLDELDSRRTRFLDLLTERFPDWETVLLVNRVNHLYFAGTMQDAVLVFQKDGSRKLFVRRSLERARDESLLPRDEILPMRSFRDVVSVIGAHSGVTCVEKDVLTISLLEMMERNFQMTRILGVDPIIARVRAVKSPWEMAWMEESGKRHHRFLTETLPTLLWEGMTELELVGDVYRGALLAGYQGISRFAMFQTEVAYGQYGFGDSSLYPTSFNGPAGSFGMSAAIPFVGSRTRRLEAGMSVFADIGFGMNGYHTDKTQVYFFRGSRPDAQIPSEALDAHAQCIEIQREIVRQLVPGAIPDQIYADVMASLSEEFKRNFQGFGSRQAKFLGHGIGLQVDEYPVIARGFTEPLQENVVLAVEPKKGIAGFGTVGVEDSFVVTSEGGRCLTGGPREIIECG